MVMESILTLVPAITAAGLSIVTIYMGYAAVSCMVSQLKGNKCPSACA